jgi:hypothetical protein
MQHGTSGSQVAARVTERADQPTREIPVSVTFAWVAAALMAGAGVIHLAFGPDHMAEYLPFGVAFYVMGFGQLIGGLAVAFPSGSRRLLSAAILANLGISALWLISRTVGLPIGSEPWTKEAVGIADVTCVAFQLGVAGLLATEMIRRPRFERLRAHRIGLPAAVAALSVFALFFVPVTVHASHTGHDMPPESSAQSAGG